jgi:glycosyltransferase involved in cell wall biosynthesis
MNRFSGAFVVHVTEGISLGLGGTARYVAELCEGLSDRGLRVEIWSPHRPGEPAFRTDHRVKVRELLTVGPASFCWSPGFTRALEGGAPGPTLIHQHGLWLDPYRRAARYARRRRIPLVVSLHGMLEPWARQRSRWKKKVAWKIFQRRDLDSAACLHVATEAEAENVRALGLKAPIAVIPNGIRLPYLDDRERHNEQLNPPLPPFGKEGLGKRMVLFLGRIHPVKGLDLLLEVWARVAPDFPDWHLVVAGPDEDGYERTLTALADRFRISPRVSFVGPVEGERKAALLKQCDFLVLPSHMESFGLVVIEALSYARPAMASKGCPWKELVSRECGWWVERTAESWEQALRGAMGQDPETLKEMGLRGRRLVEEEYSQERMIESMMKLYESKMRNPNIEIQNNFK